MAAKNPFLTTKGHIKKNQRFKSYEGETKMDQLTHIVNIDLPKFNLEIQGQLNIQLRNIICIIKIVDR